MSITVTAHTLGFTVSFPAIAETDIVGYKIHAIIASGAVNGDFVPTDSNLIYKGTETTYSHKVTIAQAVPWLVKVAAYDVFGEDNLNYSVPVSVTPLLDPTETIKLLNGDVTNDKLLSYLNPSNVAKSFVDLIETSNFATYPGAAGLDVVGNMKDVVYSLSRRAVLQAGESADQFSQLELVANRASLTVNQYGQTTGMVMGWDYNTNTATYTSEVAFVADKFKIAIPGQATSTQVFTVGTVNGQPKVGISGDLIVDGLIEGRFIKTADLRVGDGTGGTIAMGSGAYISWSNFTSDAQAAILAGAVRYTWIKYADSADGRTNFSDTPGTSGSYRTYIGIRYNNQSPEATHAAPNYIAGSSNNPDSYEWALITGSSGTQGKDGISVQVQYSVAGLSPWVSTFDSSTHKYMQVRTGNDVVGWSSWSAPMKVVGDNGSDGKHSISGWLSNDNHTIPANASGTASTYIGSSTEIRVYEGSTELTYTTSVTPGDKGKWTFTATANSIIYNSYITSGKGVVTVQLSGMADATTSATIDFSINGYNSLGEPFSFTKTQSITKVNTGATGQNAFAYWLTSGQTVVKKDANGAFSPSSVSYSAKQSNGATTSDYAGRFLAFFSADGTNFQSITLTTSDTTGVTFTVPALTVALKIQLFKTGGTSELLDEIVLPVVVDGANGLKGEKGDTGATGDKGEKGDTGAAGQDAVLPAIFNTTAPPGDGCYFGSDKFGYYKSGTWQSYIDNTGKFAFVGDASNYLKWEGSELEIKGKFNLKGTQSGAPNVAAEKGTLIGSSEGDPYIKYGTGDTEWSKIWHEKIDTEVMTKTNNLIACANWTQLTHSSLTGAAYWGKISYLSSRKYVVRACNKVSGLPAIYYAIPVQGQAHGVMEFSTTTGLSSWAGGTDLIGLACSSDRVLFCGNGYFGSSNIISGSFSALPGGTSAKGMYIAFINGYWLMIENDVTNAKYKVYKSTVANPTTASDWVKKAEFSKTTSGFSSEVVSVCSLGGSSVAIVGNYSYLCLSVDDSESWTMNLIAAGTRCCSMVYDSFSATAWCIAAFYDSVTTKYNYYVYASYDHGLTWVKYYSVDPSLVTVGGIIEVPGSFAINDSSLVSGFTMGNNGYTVVVMSPDHGKTWFTFNSNLASSIRCWLIPHPLYKGFVASGYSASVVGAYSSVVI